MFSPLPQCQVPDSVDGDRTILSGCNGMFWVGDFCVFLVFVCRGCGDSSGWNRSLSEVIVAWFYHCSHITHWWVEVSNTLYFTQSGIIT